MAGVIANNLSSCAALSHKNWPNTCEYFNPETLLSEALLLTGALSLSKSQAMISSAGSLLIA